MKNCNVIFGPPGTGKTSFLLDRIERELEAGVEPEQIAFVSYTKAAVQIAVDRAAERFGLARKRFIWFRTLHSMAFRYLGLSRDRVLASHAELSIATGLRFGTAMEDMSSNSESPGDAFLLGAALHAATGLPYEQLKYRYGLRLEVAYFEFKLQQLEKYKRENQKLDFNDMLSLYLETGDALGVTAGFVDEAQDLTPQQWHVVRKAFSKAERVFIAGDDDQAIYHWMGADITQLLTCPGTQTVLQQSYRVPHLIQQYALQIVNRIQHRKPKHWASTDQPGELTQLHHVSQIPFQANNEDWLILGRNRIVVAEMARWLRQQGAVFYEYGQPTITAEQATAFNTLMLIRSGARVTGQEFQKLMRLSHGDLYLRPHEVATPQHLDKIFPLGKIPDKQRSYISRVWNRYGQLPAPAPINFTTIHQAKGTEATNVVLSHTITRNTASAERDPEHRAFYVGATRARQRLMVLRGPAEFQYNLP